jgi:hypothetical protein
VSTKAIRQGLDLLQARHPEAYEAAKAEVEAIEAAARDMVYLDANDCSNKWWYGGLREVGAMSAIAKESKP